jgi:hypothetical protein
MTDEEAVYRPNREGFAELAVSPQVRAALLEVGLTAKTYAEGLSEEFRRTGEYAGAFEVTELTVIHRRGPRAAVRLENTAPHAAAVEWGTRSEQKPHRVLGRTLDALHTL